MLLKSHGHPSVTGVIHIHRRRVIFASRGARAQSYQPPFVCIKYRRTLELNKR